MLRFALPILAGGYTLAMSRHDDGTVLIFMGWIFFQYAFWMTNFLPKAAPKER